MKAYGMKRRSRGGRPDKFTMAAVWSLAGLQACTPMAPLVPPPLAVKPAAVEAGSTQTGEQATALRTKPLPQPPLVKPTPRPTDVADAASPPPADIAPAALNFEQVALPTFINVVYAEVLRRNVSIDPQILARRDLVTFRSGQGQTAAQIEAAVKLLLNSYGITAMDVGGLVRVVPDSANLRQMPEIRRGAALPDTPIPLRPIFHLIELQAVRQTDVANWLRTLFGDRVKVQEDASRNALLISGTPDNVKAALDAIRVLDQPLMSGRSSAAITPAYWSADELARRLADVLGAQGYAVHPIGQAFTPGAARFPVVLLPVTALNAVYVFVASPELLKHVVAVAETLDRPNERGVGKNFFTYRVQNTDAELLAQTIDKLMFGAPRGAAPAAAPGAAGAPAATARSSSVVVDKATNTLIIQTNPDEFNQMSALLRTLDRPAKAALIEVTVAEMSTDDAAQLGVEWQFREQMNNGNIATGGTLGGLALGTAGFNFRILDAVGGIRVVVNALATNNRATILSSPRVLARNGETATIQVGQEVPIVTSTQSTPVSGISNSVMQTIQYRNTGVILKVKPVIHSSDQIDLDVAQEVSEAQTTTTGVSASPTFSTRKVDTRLTLRNGATVMLGGLIGGTTSAGNSGVPLLKDIPVLGALFSNRNTGGVKRELIILITPYIVNEPLEAEALTSAFRGMLGPWAASTPAGLPQGAPATALPASGGAAAHFCAAGGERVCRHGSAAARCVGRPRTEAAAWPRPTRPPTPARCRLRCWATCSSHKASPSAATWTRRLPFRMSAGVAWERSWFGWGRSRRRRCTAHWHCNGRWNASPRRSSTWSRSRPHCPTFPCPDAGSSIVASFPGRRPTACGTWPATICSTPTCAKAWPPRRSPAARSGT